jgi:hypothetical protein
MQILVLLDIYIYIYFDAVVAFFINSLIVFRFALALMCTDTQAKAGNLAWLRIFFKHKKNWIPAYPFQKNHQTYGQTRT